MPRKKIEMTPTEASLFSEMKKLSKRANQRIVRLERLTDVKEPFAVKQLADYMYALDAWTEKGRTAVKKGLSEFQMKNIIKAMEDFLQNELSRVAGVKSYTKKQSELAGVPISYEYANTLYKSMKNYTWIYDYMTPSDFWTLSRETVKNGWNAETFIEKIMVYITDRTLDEELINDLVDLYYYANEVKV